MKMFCRYLENVLSRQDNSKAILRCLEDVLCRLGKLFWKFCYPKINNFFWLLNIIKSLIKIGNIMWTNHNCIFCTIGNTVSLPFNSFTATNFSFSLLITLWPWSFWYGSFLKMSLETIPRKTLPNAPSPILSFNVIVEGKTSHLSWDVTLKK